MAEEITWVRMVKHPQRAAYEALGWVWDADLGPIHGHWSVLMRWPFPGDPKEPS